MSLRRIGILLGKELFQGPKNFLFVTAIVTPVIISLVVSLIFGSFFTEKPKLGIVDQGSSQLVSLAQSTSSLITREYSSTTAIKQAVTDGTIDIGIVLPTDFDSTITQGETSEIQSYVWGESLAKNRTILGVTIATLIRDIAGQETPVAITSITLGEEVSIPWNQRLLPMIVLMAVFIGGMFFPATSVINEKEKRTLQALVITPASLSEVLTAKGLMGIIISLFVGIAILILNQAFGSAQGLLVLVLALGAVMAAWLGLVCGIVIKDLPTMFAVWKFGGIILFGPALIYMFPQIPQWVGRIFPTYYLIQPIFELSQGGAGWPAIATNVFILIGLDIALFSGMLFVLNRFRR